MASSSSSCIKRFHVFPSFHGPDVRKRFLSHLQYHFESKGIRTFKDQEIVRGQTIGPELVHAIRESRISLVVFSKKYASSSWCLDELVEILNCKEAQGQIVLTIFYEVDPSDVKKQRGDFGKTFEKTCEGKSEEVKLRWSKALSDVATIAGEHSFNWSNEAEMIEKIATDVSKKVNVTASRDFEGIVGLEAHLTKLNSLLRIECDEVQMIGIWGPAGIGKTTIARALFNQLSSSFQLKCFMENLKEMGVDDYKSKLELQNQLLSEILNQRNMRVDHLGSVKEWLQDQRVLIILDDVDDLEKLVVLAKELSWFGYGSRIIVTTEDKKILKGHGIQDIYHVHFPSKEEALEILCLSAFKQSSVQDGFEELAKKVAEFCGNLPLGLCVVGASLRGDSKHEWELQLSKIGTTLNRKIEDVLKVGYDRLLKKEQSLFLHIACFFNKFGFDRMKSVLYDSNLDVGNCLRTLADKSLVQISTDDYVGMHQLLQQLGREIVIGQSKEPGKRQFLTEPEEICDVLTNETGTGSVIGISLDKPTNVYAEMDHILQQLGRKIVIGQSDEPRQFLPEPEEICDVLTNETGTGSVIGISLDRSKNREVCVSSRAFEGMHNLRFLRIFGTLQIPKDMKYLPRLRLLDWSSYPRKSLPPRFLTEGLVEICMISSNLEKLWSGIQPLPILKTLNLSLSTRLKEIPNLSKATELQKLILFNCVSLVELPSSISNLHKLKTLVMNGCTKLRVIPTNINLASLEILGMMSCSQLRSFPDISRNIKTLNLLETEIEDIPPSVVGCWFRLDRLLIGGRSLDRLTYLPLSITSLELENSDIKSIPDCVISLLHLVELVVRDCRKLVIIQALPPSLKYLEANESVSLQRVCFCSSNQTKILQFFNCFKLDEETRRGIIQQSTYDYTFFPGEKLPPEFTHRATGKSITIPLAPGTLSASSRFKACFLILPTLSNPSRGDHYISCSLRNKGCVIFHTGKSLPGLLFACPWSKHLLIFHGDLFEHEVDETMSEIIFEFGLAGNDDKIIECGVQMMTEEDESSSRNSEVDNFETEIISSNSKVDNFEPETSRIEVDNIETERIKSKANYHETEGNNNLYTDKVESCAFSQVENIKTSKHTRFRSWLRKLGLKRRR